MGLGLTSLRGMLGPEGAREELEAQTSQVPPAPEGGVKDGSDTAVASRNSTPAPEDPTAKLVFKRRSDLGQFT